jgi:hypothetical protein
MEFTFHNSYIILELVPSTVIFWTELSCWRKSYSNKDTLLLGWSHPYKNSTIVITIWLTVTKYSYLKWQWIFYFLHRCFLSSITAKTFTGLDCINEWQGGCLIRSRNCLPFAGTWVHHSFLVGSVLLIVLVFCIVLLCVLTFFSSVLCCPLRFPHKNDVQFIFTSTCL